MNEQLKIPFNEAKIEKAALVNREDYMTSSRLVELLKLSQPELATVSELIGCQPDPLNQAELLFDKEEVFDFTITSRLYSTLCHLSLFANPVCDTHSEDRIADGWLREKLIRLCELHREGNKDGITRICQDIKSWQQNGGQS